MFEDVEFFRRSAKEKLDLFEEQNEDPSFINYAMLEVKDGDQPIDLGTINLVGSKTKKK